MVDCFVKYESIRLSLFMTLKYCFYGMYARYSHCWFTVSVSIICVIQLTWVVIVKCMPDVVIVSLFQL